MSKTDNQDMSIVELMRELHDEHGKAPTYAQVWHAVVQNQIPAERVRGRWRIRRGDKPRAAIALGLMPTA